MKIPQIRLDANELPTRWYNIIPDLPDKFPPPKDPEEGESRLKLLPKILNPLCLKQEMSTENWITIPEEIRELLLRSGRPRPLFRAIGLERALKLPKTIKLFYKSEFYSPTGSHKVNTAVAQLHYAKEQGYERVVTETGAGQFN